MSNHRLFNLRWLAGLVAVLALFAGIFYSVDASNKRDSSNSEGTVDRVETHDGASADAPAEEHGHDDSEEDSHGESSDDHEQSDSHEEIGLSDETADEDGHDDSEEAAHSNPAEAHEDEDDHDVEAASGGSDDGHGHDSSEEAGGGHGHGEPQIGYIGIEEKLDIDPHDVEHFTERVQEEAYEKGTYDQIRFILFGVLFVVVYLAFAKIKFLNISQRLRDTIDWYTLGTVTGIILIFLIIPSGIIITFFYMPTSTEAYASVDDMANNSILAFFRNLHNWSSEIFIFLSLLHAARTVSTGTFLAKRKLIWLVGALAIIVGWIAFLSGTFMRADQEALEGFEHMMYSFSLVPLGDAVANFFSGELTMMKLTALHIGLTIFLLALTLVLHVLMRKVHVLVTMRWKKAVAYSVALTVILVAQSFLMEAPFIRGLESGPTISGIEATKPPWPIYFLIQGENWFGANAMVAILLVAFLPLVIFPYAVEFLPIARAKKARVGEILFYAGVFAMIGVSYIAAASEIQAHIF